MKFRRELIILSGFTAALTTARIALAAHLDLSPDEAYYYAWSLSPAAGYLDHPPMVAWLIHLSTSIFGSSELAVRVPALLSGLLIPFLIFFTIVEAGGTAGWALLGSVFSTLTPLASAGGIIVTPDAPFSIFWAAGLLSYVRIARSDGSGSAAERVTASAVAGIFIGLAMLSKYTGALLALAPLAFIAYSGNRRRDFIYMLMIPGAAALVTYLPNLLYNLNAGFRSVAFQWGHVFGGGESDAFVHLPEFLGGQIGVVGPFIFAAALYTAVAAFRRGVEPAMRISALSCAVPLAVSLFAAVFNKVEANWPAAAYMGAVVFSATVLAGSPISKREKTILKIALGYGVASVLAIYTHAATPWIPIPADRDPVLGQLYGWKDLTDSVEKMIETASGPAGKTPVTFSYRLSSELFYYSSGKIRTICLDRRFTGDRVYDTNGADRWIAIEQYPAKKADALMTGVCRNGYSRSGVLSSIGDSVIRRIDLFWCGD